MEHLIYLAGPITGLTFDGATDWREYARTKFEPNITGLSPMRAKDYLKDAEALGDHYDDFVLSTSRGIMTRDSFDVRRCDMLLVNLLGAEKISIGTMIEVGMAFALNKPLVLVLERTKTGRVVQEANTHNHAMLREAAGWWVETLDEGIFVVNATLGGA